MTRATTTGPHPPLRLKADWGGANLLRASGWLTQWVWDHTDDPQPSVIYTGRGMGDNVRAVAGGEVDVALMTPAAFARLAVDGRGPFEGRSLSNLAAIAALPHRDAMIPVARRGIGIETLADVNSHDGPLRVSLGVNDPDGFMGLGGDIVLAAGGIDLDQIEARGGVITRHEQPFAAIADLRDGRADLMVSEAIMTPDWQKLAATDVEFLTLTDAEQAWIAQEWGFDCIEVPGGYFEGHPKSVVALNYSDWLVVTTVDLPDDQAALLARAFVEDGESFARGYRHLPVEYSPLRYPIDYRIAAQTPIPLHPAAAAVYENAERRGVGTGRTALEQTGV